MCKLWDLEETVSTADYKISEEQKSGNLVLSRFPRFLKELLTGIGPVTSALPMRRSTD